MRPFKEMKVSKMGLILGLTGVACAAGAGMTLGGYTTTTDVTDHSRMALDTGLFSTMSKSNFTNAKRIYVNGYNSCQNQPQSRIEGCMARTLQLMTAYVPGDPYSEAFKAFYGVANSWDPLVLDTLDGTNGMDSKTITFRTTILRKAPIGIMANAMFQPLEKVKTWAAAGNFSLAQHELDISWAYYYGVPAGSFDPALESKVAPSKVNGGRDTDFPDGTQSNLVVTALYNKLQRELSLESSEVPSTVAAIYTVQLIPWIRCAIKYPYKLYVSLQEAADGSKYSGKYHAEGYAYWRGASGYIAKLDQTAADTVENLIFWNLGPGTVDNDVHCKAKKALEAAYYALGVDCAMVGTYKSYDTDECGSVCMSRAVKEVGVFGLPLTEQSMFGVLGVYGPVSNTTDYADLVQEVVTFASAAQNSFTLAEDIYTRATGTRTNGETLQHLNNKSVSGGRYFDAYESFYQSPSSWDDLLSLALNGTGAMAAKNDVFRQGVASKGVLGLVNMAILGKLDTASELGKLYRGGNSLGAHPVDEAWALCYGPASLSGEKSIYGIHGELDTDFPYGTKVQELVPALFQQARLSLEALTYDQAKADVAIEGIYKGALITFIRCAIKYSYLTQQSLASAYSAKHHSEGYTYWRAVSGYVASINRTAADIVEAMLSWEKDETALASDMHCRIKHALEGSYKSLGLSCSMIGGFKDYAEDICGSFCLSPIVDALPLGNPASLLLKELSGNGWDSLGLYTPLADVRELAKLSLDTDLFNMRIKTNYTLAGDIYRVGRKSNGYTLQGLNAPHNGDPYYEAYKLFYSSDKSYDDLISLALSGTGDMSGKNEVFRQSIGQKGMLGLVVLALHERLEDAVKQFNAADYTSAVKAWDEAYALYCGEDAAASPCAVAGERDIDFPDGTPVSAVMIRFFMQGQKYLQTDLKDLAEDLAKVIEARDAIYKGVLITFLRCAIMYSKSVQDSLIATAYSAKDHAEGYGYWRVVSAYVASLNPTAGAAVEQAMLWTKDSSALATDMHCKVKTALEGAYASMSLDCTMIGEFKATVATVCGAACQSPVATPLPPGEVFTRSAEASCAAKVAEAAFDSSCTTGEQSNGVSCVKCRKGKYNPQSSETCKDCPPGFFSNTSGATFCWSCPEGQYNGGDIFTANTECLFCPSGKHAPVPGSTQCVNCATGSVNNMQGSSLCYQCVAGKYQDEPGMQKCDSCTGKTPGSSSERGAKSAEECLCGPGTEHRGQECMDCEEGIECLGGNKEAKVLAGFYAAVRGNDTDAAFAGVQTRYSVFKCHKDERSCPLGPVGACAVGRQGIACSVCKDDKVPNNEDGTCKDCEGGDVAPFVLAVIFLVAVMNGMYYLIDNENRAKQPHSTLLVAIVAGMAVTTFQQMGVLSAVDIPWVEPIKSMLIIMRLLDFDLELVRIGCIFTLSPLSQFLGKLITIVAVFTFLLLVHTFWVLVKRGGKFRARFSSLVGVMGTTFMIFFISVTNTTILPLQCIDNPNGLRTVRRFPTIICWEMGEHTTMVAVGLVFLLVPIFFVASGFFAVWQYPKRMMALDSKFLHMTAFLFFRFKPEAYWFTMVFIMRNLFLALAPTLPGSLSQVIAIISLLLIALVTSSMIFPWRVLNANYLDAAITMCMVLMLSTAGFFVEDIDAKPVGILAAAFVVCIFALMFFLVAYVVITRFILAQKLAYDFFICHHKSAAGAFARLLKMRMGDPNDLNKNVWVDCDDLTNIDKLFDYVGSHCETVVVLMTKEILQRPWCIGELVTAHVNQPSIKMCQILFPDYVKPDETFISEYGSNIDIGCLGPHGMNVLMVQDMLKWMLTIKGIQLTHINTDIINELGMALAAKQFQTVLKKQGSRQNNCSLMLSGALSRDMAQTSCVVDDTNMEAVATGLVLCMLVAHHTAHDARLIPQMILCREGLPPATTTCCFIMVNGIFQNPAFLNVMIQAAQQNCRHLPIIAEDSFRFPSNDMLRQLDEQMPMMLQQDDIVANATVRGIEVPTSQTVLNLIRDMFKEIAIVFAPQVYSSTEELLKIRAKEITERLLGTQLKNLALRSDERQESSKSNPEADVKEIEADVKEGQEANKVQDFRPAINAEDFNERDI